MGEWTFPVWATAQVCLVLYLIGVGLPYAFQYTNHKECKRLKRVAIDRYETQKQEIIRKCREQEKLKAQRALQAAPVRNKRPVIAKPNASLRTNVRINISSSSSSRNSSTSSSSSSSSSISSDSSIEETTEEEEEEMLVKNDRAMLMQYVHGMDLFDGQSSTTSASAATTIIFDTAKKAAAAKKLGGVRYL